MATTKQKKVFKAVVNGSTIKSAMVKAGYSESTSRRTNKVTRTKGWAELMEKELPDGLLAEKHRELLEKREVYKIGHGESTEHEISDQPETNAVSKALDMAYKLKGKYAPDKHLNVNVEIETPPEIKQLTDKLNEIYRSSSVPGDGGKPGLVDDKAQDQE